MKRLLQTLFFFLLVTQICFAQWVQVGLNDKSIKDIAVYNSLIFVVTSDSGKLYRSIDNGINWSTIFELGVIDVDISPTGDVFMLKDSIYNTGPKQLFRSTDAGSSWNYLNVIEQIPHTYPINGPNNVRISPTGTIFCWYFETHRWPSSSIAISTDNGISWMPEDHTGGLVYDFRDNSIITCGWVTAGAAGLWFEIYLSDDGGLQWTDLGNAPPPWGIEVETLRLCLNGNILAGGEGMFLSDDSCNSWTQISTIIPTCGLSIESGGMLVGTDSLGLFMFSDNGDSLGSFNEGLSNLNTHILTMDINGYIYLGTDNGVWRRPLSEIVPVELTSFTASVNGKEVILNWSTATELNNHGFEIQRSIEGKEFFTVGFVNGHGTTTEHQNYSYADRIFDDGKYFYRLKQVDYDGSYEYSDVVEVEWRAFSSYLLEQNFPNPFNPNTTFGFGLQNKSNVKIIILNAIGEEVAVVLNEEREAGYHTVKFNAANLPSGVYFYQLKAGSFVETKKMLLLK